jgi:two-component system, response regulator
MMTSDVILIVEDNPDDEELTLRAFKRNRILNEVVIARDGQEALDYLFGEGEFAGRDPNDRPSIVLLDLNLPKVSGLDVLRRLRADPRTELVPVVVLTTSREEQDVVESYRLRANSYIRKPVGFEKFVDAVSQLGLYWLMLNERPYGGDT